jgi:hypothetical protein
MSRENGVYPVFDRPHRIETPSTFRTPAGKVMNSGIEATFEDLDGRRVWSSSA